MGRVGKYSVCAGLPLPGSIDAGTRAQGHTQVIDGKDAEAQNGDPNLDQHAVNPSRLIAVADGDGQLRG